jgi:hypothetical protein
VSEKGEKNKNNRNKVYLSSVSAEVEACIAASRLKPNRNRLYRALRAVNAIKNPPQDPAMMRLEQNEKL